MVFFWSCFGWGLHGSCRYRQDGSLLHCLSTLTCSAYAPPAVYFCCTGLGVTSTGRYPASCPVKPGLSSPAAFRHLQLRLSVLLVNAHFTTRDGKSKVGMIKKKKLSAPYFLQNRKLSIPATQIIINYLHCCYCQ